MALASWNLTSLAFKGLLSASHHQRLFSAAQPTPNLILPRHCLSRSVLAFSRRRKSNSPVQSSKKNKEKKDQVKCWRELSGGRHCNTSKLGYFPGSGLSARLLHPHKMELPSELPS
ncbi:hypothetical protein CK203_005249 [Vitis vinifera]|uniref:Uncharacterized protein n=1 Tax=Vitis vinifera TaxID=29760 RepID=A0A438KEU8_VITVI|nr:hypothetical protein CK203_005249 [Vitis vinifera]